MNKLNLVLTVDEIQALSNEAGPDNPLGLARAVERATLERLSKRPPAAWQQLVYELCVREATKRNMLPKSIYNCMMKGTGNGGLYPDPLASLAELALSAITADAEPDMFWNADDPERCESSVHDVLVGVDAEAGAIVEIQQAMRLGNVTVKVASYDEDENEYTYEVVEND